MEFCRPSVCPSVQARKPRKESLRNFKYSSIPLALVTSPFSDSKFKVTKERLMVFSRCFVIDDKFEVANTLKH